MALRNRPYYHNLLQQRLFEEAIKDQTIFGIIKKQKIFLAFEKSFH